MDITDREALARRLSETYTGGRYTDPWESVEEYFDVLEYTARFPNKGSAAVANALELPRSRIRPWMDDGSRPDPVRAVQVAEEREWLDLDWESTPFTGLNVLVAWIFSSGSLGEHYYTPQFHVTDETLLVLETALDAANAPPHTIERVDDDRRGMEVHITEHRTIFGRFLHILGAPVGPKNQQTHIELPPYLANAPEAARLQFARTYVWHRGTSRPDKPTRPVQITEERPAQYRKELEAFLNRLVPGEVSGDSWPMYLTRAGAQRLYQPPKIE